MHVIRRPLVSSLSLLLLVSASCTADNAGLGADGGSTTLDADITANADAQVDDRARGSAIIVPIAGGTPEIAVMTLHADGNVDDYGLRLPTGMSPRRAAVHPSGREAAVIWAGGGPGSPKGVTFVDLSGDPAVNASISFELDFNVSDDATEYQQSPTDIIYVNADELLITLRGPGADGAIPAFRTQAGWELGKFIEIDPGGLAAPLEVHGIPGTEDALVMTFPDKSRVYTIRRSAPGEWDQVGDFHELDTSSLRIAVHPDGTHAYVATSAPVQNQGQIPKGELHVLTPGPSGAWLEASGPTLLSGAGSQITMDPAGAFAIVPDIQESIDKYNFLTIDLSSPGVPVENNSATTVDGFLMRDFEIGPEGQMIVSLDLPNGGGKVLYTMVQQAPGQWQTVWGPTTMPAGVDDVAVARVSVVID